MLDSNGGQIIPGNSKASKKVQAYVEKRRPKVIQSECLRMRVGPRVELISHNLSIICLHRSSRQHVTNNPRSAYWGCLWPMGWTPAPRNIICIYIYICYDLVILKQKEYFLEGAGFMLELCWLLAKK